MRIQRRKSVIEALASRYVAEDDDRTLTVLVTPVRKRGCLTRPDLETVCRWKSRRALPHVQRNSDGEVRELTGWALTTKQERLRIETLLVLHGVSWPMASVILHWFHDDPYPILDVRALWSLELTPPSTCNFDFWWSYVEKCRSLSSELSVPMRTLDRALWRFSYDNGGPGSA